jgi:glyoxylase-like metal-dependent hydrolase (beta-lactamase superfamily II)
MSSPLQIEAFYDAATFTYSYLVLDLDAREAAVIDSVLDFDAKSGRTTTASADALRSRLNALAVSVRWHLETHVHADHLSGAIYLKQQLGGMIAIGARVRTVQEVFGKIFNAGPEFARDGSQFDRLLKPGDVLSLGRFGITVMPTPGHTPACLSYRIDDGSQSHVFVGDTLFMPDFGTARCDFPGGDAGQLFDSIQSLLTLPPETLLYMCHDYPPKTREARYQVTVAEQRKDNIHVHDGISRDDFVQMRKARDATLAMPALILPSVQINMRAGAFPPADSNGVSYLKLPINLL